MRRGLVLIVAIALVGALSADAGARTLLGVRGDVGRFKRLTGGKHAVGHLMIGWNKGLRPGGPRLDRLIESAGSIPMIHVGTGTGWPSAREAITPREIARGEGDRFLVALNREIAAFGGLVYVRPLAEMNAYWSFYSAFNQNGTRRDAAHSTRWFKKAFARISLIVRGGSRGDVNRELTLLGLPGVKRHLATTRARVIWNPQGFGNPRIPANAPQAYWPGGKFVDVVGDDLYDRGGKVEWRAAKALYRRYRNKPYAIPEWGLWGTDDARFVYRMARFVRTHRRVELIAYFQSKPGSIFDLASKPRALSAYRRAIAPLADR